MTSYFHIFHCVHSLALPLWWHQNDMYSTIMGTKKKKSFHFSLNSMHLNSSFQHLPSSVDSSFSTVFMSSLAFHSSWHQSQVNRFLIRDLPPPTPCLFWRVNLSKAASPGLTFPSTEPFDGSLLMILVSDWWPLETGELEDMLCLVVFFGLRGALRSTKTGQRLNWSTQSV